MACPTCGAENPGGKRFCADCGTALAAACPSCGASSPPGKRFCADCGATLGAAGPQGAASPERAASGNGAVAERRLVSVLFADLVGFTTFAEGRDAEEVRETQSRYFELAREVIGRYGGTVEKFIGDAVMAIWGAPTAREDDAERAVRAALDLVDAIPRLGAGMQVRCGVLTGEAAVTLGAVGEGMVAGDLVNTAARLQSVAPAGAVLVGEATQRAADRAIAFERVGEQELKGKASPVPAWRALRIVAEVGGRNRTARLEAPFVGRADELRLLKDLFHATSREGRLHLVSVIGPAGIGKSRLAWEFLKYVDGLVDDVLWHDGRSPAYGDGVTFWALGEMVRGRCGLAETDDEATTRTKVAATLEEYAPDLEERRWLEPALLALLGLGSSPATEQLFAAWRRFFELLSARAPVVMVFEDLHFADSGLLDFVESLLEWSRATPIYVLALARPELLDRRRDWGAGRRNFHSLYLEPLSAEAMRELLLGLVPGLPEPAIRAIVSRADGMPLYAVETVRMLLAEGRLREQDGRFAPHGDLTTLAVPETLTALIGARLDALDPDDRALMQDAAVLGQSFTPPGLAAVSGRDEVSLAPRLRDLVRREMLTLQADPRSPERGQYAFVQALIREVIYNTLARRDRKVRHLAAARYFETLATDELAGILAGQYLAAYQNASDEDEAATLGIQARLALSAAADRAVALGSHDSALAFLLQAVEVTRAPEEQAALLDRAGVAAATAAHYARAEELYARALDILRRSGDEDGIVAGTARLAYAMIAASRIPEAVELAEGLDGSLPTVRDETRALLHSVRAHALMRAGRHPEAIAAADRALGFSEPLRLDRITAETLVNKASSLGFLGRLHEPIALFAAARSLAADNGWTSLELRAANNSAVTYVNDDLRRAAELVREALALATRTGDRAMELWLVNVTAQGAAVLADGWDEALMLLESELGRDHEPRDLVALVGNRAYLDASRGRPIEGDLLVLQSLEGQVSDPNAIAGVVFVRGTLALLHGDMLAAREQLEIAASVGPYDSGGVAAVAQVAILERDAGQLRELIPLLEQHPAVWQRQPQGDLVRARAGLDALEGRTQEALSGYARALALYSESGADWTVAQTAIDMAAVLDSGHPEVAAAIARAREIWGRVGATAWVARLDAVLASRTASAPEAAEPV
jgi:class 3 adenylate cyclase/tetratricopeptide (TPR) repeat protein